MVASLSTSNVGAADLSPCSEVRLPGHGETDDSHGEIPGMGSSAARSKAEPPGSGGPGVALAVLLIGARSGPAWSDEATMGVVLGSGWPGQHRGAATEARSSKRRRCLDPASSAVTFASGALSSPWASMDEDLLHLIAWRVLAADPHGLRPPPRRVCRHWRSSTACPRGRGVVDGRFHPRRWVMLPEGHGLHPAHGKLRGHVHFFNLGTGKFLRARVPIFKDHCVVDSVGGVLVMSRDEDTAVRLFTLSPATIVVRISPPCRFAVNRNSRFAPLHSVLYLVRMNFVVDQDSEILQVDPPQKDDGSSVSSLPAPKLIATILAGKLAHPIFLVECDSQILVVGHTDNSFSRMRLLLVPVSFSAFICSATKVNYKLRPNHASGEGKESGAMEGKESGAMGSTTLLTIAKMPRKLVKKLKVTTTIESSSSELDIPEQLQEFSESTISTNTLIDMVLDTCVSHPPLPPTEMEGVDYAAKPLPHTNPARISSSASVLQTDSVDAGGSIVPDVNLPSTSELPHQVTADVGAKEQTAEVVKQPSLKRKQSDLQTTSLKKKVYRIKIKQAFDKCILFLRENKRGLNSSRLKTLRYLDTLTAEKNDLAKSLKEQSIENAQLKKNLEVTEEKLKQAKSSEKAFKSSSYGARKALDYIHANQVEKTRHSLEYFLEHGPEVIKQHTRRVVIEAGSQVLAICKSWNPELFEDQIREGFNPKKIVDQCQLLLDSMVATS
ncbi:hypothetical protein PR202_ga17240 [Eleusine coracana subsp. coracana]|uniref:Uncharacterized protein n=1 Tax=Eleusine coracana subsp. coracana TaxID=191504 RepID=A0AAV5CQF2_ELECO|nr:hypothetical protein PR202_ga17240 [Eleusine coracana subsp. coracana]